MTIFKKRFLIGMISGAIIFAGGLGTYKALAAPVQEQIEQTVTRPQMPKMSEPDMSIRIIAGKTIKASNKEDNNSNIIVLNERRK